MSEQEHATRLLQALADPTRLRLVAALLEQPACVEELAERLGLSAPTISHHLGRLDQAGLLNRRREQYYTVCEARPGPLARTLRELVATAADQPGAEEARLAPAPTAASSPRSSTTGACGSCRPSARSGGWCWRRSPPISPPTATTPNPR